MRGLSFARHHAREALGRGRTRLYPLRYRQAEFGPGFHARGALRIAGDGRVVFGAGVFVDHRVRATEIHLSGGATVWIGEGCYLNGPQVIAAADVTIGARCIVGDASIFTTNFHSTRADRHTPDAPVRVAPVVLEENVWLAGQVAIMPGVRIGRDAVVAFRSVITEDVEPGVIVSSHAQRTVRPIAPPDPRS